MPGGDRVDSLYALSNGNAVSASTVLAVTTSTDSIGPLAAGLHELVSDADCWIRQGGSGVEAAATAPSHYLPAKTPRLVFVTGSADGYVAGITASGTATLAANPY